MMQMLHLRSLVRRPRPLLLFIQATCLPRLLVLNANRGCSTFLVRSFATSSNLDKSHVVEIPKDDGQSSKAGSGETKYIKLFAVVNGKRGGVQIADNQNIDDLRTQIKTKFARELDPYDATDLVVKLSADAKHALDPEDVLRDVLVDVDGKPVKYVYVETPTDQMPRTYELQNSRGSTDWDGITLNDSFRLVKLHLVNEIFEHGHVLLKGPPACGKTSLLQTFVTECVRRQKKTVVVHAMPNVDAEAYVVKHAEAQGYNCVSVQALMRQIDYLILDDAQKFWPDTAFWTNLKLPQGYGRIIAAATYDLKTFYPDSPAIFGHKISDFKMSKEEEDFIVSQMRQVYSVKVHPWIYNDWLMNVIRVECSGSVGALRICFSILTKKFVKAPTGALDVFDYFLSRAFFDSCDARRMFNNIDVVNQRHILERIFLNDGTYKCSIADSDADALVRVSVLWKESVDDGIQYSFSTLLHRRYYFCQMYTKRSSSMPQNPDELIKQSVSRMSFHSLAEGFKHVAGAMPKEALFKMELYRCIHELTTATIRITPEVDRIVDEGLIAKGNLRTSIADFWIGGTLRWLVECVVMLTVSEWERGYKDRVQQHWDQLRPHQKLLVDFRSDKPPTSLLLIPEYRAVVIDFHRKTARYITQSTSEDIVFGWA